MVQDMYALVFEFLSLAIYEEVECAFWFHGMPNVIKGRLEKVEAFDYVSIDKNIIPFVGSGMAIEEIKKVKNGNVIYTNPKALNYNIKDPMGVINSQREMLGYSVDMERLEEHTLGKYGM